MHYSIRCGKENVIHNPLCESGFILIEITISITCMNIDGLWIFQCLLIHKCFIDFHWCVNLIICIKMIRLNKPGGADGSPAGIKLRSSLDTSSLTTESFIRRCSVN